MSDDDQLGGDRPYDPLRSSDVYRPPQAALTAEDGLFTVPVASIPRFGPIMSRGWTCYRQHLGELLRWSFIAAVPAAVVVAILFIFVDTETGRLLDSATGIVIGTAKCFLTGATVYVLVQSPRRGQAAPLSEVARFAQQRFWIVAGAAVAVNIVTGLLTCLLFIPGLVAYVGLALVDPIVAMRGSGVNALTRSWELVKPRWFLVAGVVAAVLIPGFLGIGLGVGTASFAVAMLDELVAMPISGDTLIGALAGGAYAAGAVLLHPIWISFTTVTALTMLHWVEPELWEDSLDRFDMYAP